MSLSELKRFLTSIIAEASKQTDSLRLMIFNPQLAYYFTLSKIQRNQAQTEDLIRNVNVSKYIKILRHSQADNAITTLIGALSTPAAQQKAEEKLRTYKPPEEEGDIEIEGS